MKSLIRTDIFFLKKFLHLLNREMVPLEIIDVHGNRYRTGRKEIKHRLHIRDNKFFKALISPDAFALGDAYVNGYFDVSGNIKELYELVCNTFLTRDRRKNILQRLASFFQNDEIREKENIKYHYDVPSLFYRRFLGRTMGYTCGYYPGADTTRDEAQSHKMDMVCRKLRLKKDEYLLDIGCGWGSFAVHAATRYGVRVKGITLSREQKKYADDQIKKLGLSGQVEIQLLNYRHLGTEIFDKISCIGMSEHVGKKNMPEFFSRVNKCLRPGGLFMQHTITTNEKRKKGYENSFLDRYMFPGGELMFEHELLEIAEQTGFELLNAENFRPHYVRTLKDWIHGMETDKNRLLEVVSEHVYRIYHIFFIGSMVSFRQKEISLFQNLFYKTKAGVEGTLPFHSPWGEP